MQSNDPQGLRRTASIQFVDALLDEDRGAVVDFDSRAILLQPLTPDKAALRAAINRIDSSGGTDIGAGVSQGLSALAANTDDTRVQLMILLTDGVGSYNDSLTTQAASAGVTIYTVGLGSGVDGGLLTRIAQGTGGAYYPVADASDLPEVFREIEEDTGDDGTDTDGDGLSDCDEETGVADYSGLVFTSDPRLADTDGDGLTDGDEVNGEVSDLARLILGPLADEIDLRIVFSDPRLVDTDGDGLTDGEEADQGTRARGNDTDGDFLDDFAEVEQHGTNPRRANTDGDQRDDGFEVLNAGSGFDPIFADEEQSKWAYAGDFVLGGICPLNWGFCERDSIAWLAGNLGGGFLVYKDVLDIIGGITTLDFVGGGLSAAALLPVVGDGASIVTKGVRFINRVSRRGGEALAYILKLPDLPFARRIDLLQQVDGPAVGSLRAAGVTDDAIVAAARSRHPLGVLASAVDEAAELRRSPARYRLEKDAENYLRGTIPGALPTQRGFPPVGWRPGDGTRGYRFPDIYDDNLQLAVEVKHGFTRGAGRAGAQVPADVALRADPGTPIRRVEWHFFPDQAGRVGPDDELRRLLTANNIPYVIHQP